MKKWLTIALVSFALLAAGYIALPRYAIEQLEMAARDENEEQLQRYIDFPALRDNLRLRLQRKLRESVNGDVPEEFREFLAAGVNLFVSPLLQQLVTPEGIGELLRGGKDLREFELELYRMSSSVSGDVVDVPENEENTWQLRRWRFVGVNLVSADYGGDTTARLRLILERRGLRWQLVDLHLLGGEKENE
ncbi:Protein of unknown function [Microbulbifer thermotolerans]|uniref:DUF2939 domain-containing protein n=1 Tax=Microbulbifer thermotolerans TaxID=252514 RepID=UPI0008EC7695|nr:DUF2939 domain-containing protein [Microbulbifer thermotolerans]SFC08183.1 Protein of unknown function [Microbulbifer thermotolerans]